VAFTALKHPLKQALLAATLNASSVVRYADTQSGLLRYAELEEQVLARESEVLFRSWPI
jgi:hypothetical protein